MRSIWLHGVFFEVIAWKSSRNLALRQHTACPMCRPTINALACTAIRSGSRSMCRAISIRSSVGCRTSLISAKPLHRFTSALITVVSTTSPGWRIQPAKTCAPGYGANYRPHCQGYAESSSARPVGPAVPTKDRSGLGSVPAPGNGSSQSSFSATNGAIVSCIQLPFG